LLTACRFAASAPLSFFDHCSPVQVSRIVPSPRSSKHPEMIGGSVLVVVVDPAAGVVVVVGSGGRSWRHRHAVDGADRHPVPLSTLQDESHPPHRLRLPLVTIVPLKRGKPSAVEANV
jgi:hypothetical protein